MLVRKNNTQFEEELRITDTHYKILKTMLALHREEGLTSYQLRKAKFPARTFDINRQFLLDSKLIKVVRETKAGRQTRIFYDVTPLGFFMFLKSNFTTDKDFDRNNIGRFTPMIIKYWDKTLHPIFKNYLHSLFLLTLQSMSIMVRTIPIGKPISTKNLELIIAFPTLDSDVKITIRKNFYSLSNEVDYSGITIDEGDTVSNDITKIWTFLFYINLIIAHADNERIAKLSRQIWMKKGSDKGRKFYEKLTRDTKKGSKDIITIIRQDHELSSLLNEQLKGIHDKIKIKSLDMLIENLLR